MLDRSDIAHYLGSLGVVKPRAASGGSIAEASQRNRVHVVTTRRGPTYVIKEAGPSSAATLAHEAAVLRVLAGMPELACRAPASCATSRSTPGSSWRRPPAPATGPATMPPGGFLGSRRGTSVARSRRCTASRATRSPRCRAAAIVPGGFRCRPPEHERLLDMSAGGQEVVARVQANAGMCRRLDELRGECADDATVHGDLRWDNCLALAAPGAARRTRLLLIDWELAGAGPAAFDAGTVVAEYLRAWVWSIPIADPREPGRLAAYARRPLTRMHPAVQAFWSAYAAARPDPPPLRRVVRLAAVRLLQNAVERSERMTRASAHVVTLLQLADGMLRRPDDAAALLLGLRA